MSAPDTTTPFMARLKEATDDLHSYAERRPLQRSLLKGTLPQQDYAAYLGQLLWVHRTLERELAAHAGAHPAIAAVVKPHQRREQDLREDIRHYGGDPDSSEALTPTSLLVQQIETTARTQPVALLGLLYVLEGSTNGSKFIAKALSRAWGVQAGAGLKYLDPYGDDQPQLWQEFKQAMNGIDFTDSEQEAIIGSARTMFQAVADISDATFEPIPA